ncbi:Na+/H+ antiporter subunit E [Massilia sp. BSC265]|uniref:Na+/H+ antiporter subunit E n=1 Tax=Massilia sp. BSC265 TaxID=1549812 RepID=UPI0004E9543B|nr:Na+/H+ antiporter subunit E [Massilia sp. BSC265]KFI07175.1 hypothetical protein JN27_11540 [Massilia sp. BSC265]
MKRFAAAVLLLWRLIVGVVHAGLHISWRTLHRPRAFAPGFAEYRFAPMGSGATTVLACLISLTPGTTAVDVDAAGGCIRLHLLDGDAGDNALREIRAHFEDPLRVLFNKEEAA